MVKRLEIYSSGKESTLEIFAATEGVTLRVGLEIWRLAWAQLDELRPKAAPKKPRAVAVKRATQAPDIFPLTQERLRWASNNLSSAVDVRGETAQFLDYYRSTGRARVSWEASWRNWMRKAAGYAKSEAKPESARGTRSVKEQLESSARALELAGEDEAAEEIRRRLDGKAPSGTTAKTGRGMDRPHA